MEKDVEDVWRFYPPEILIQIFSYFSPPQLIHLSTVSKRFNEIALSDPIWKRQELIANALFNHSQALYIEIQK